MFYIQCNKRRVFWKICLQLFIAFIFICSYRTDAKEAITLRYTFAKKNAYSVTITIQLINSQESKIPFLLPSKWAGQDSLYKCITDVRPISKHTKVISTNRPDSFVVTTIKGKEIIFEYTLQQDWNGSISYPIYFRPIINDTVFFISGYGGLIYPKLHDSISFRCGIEYKDFTSENYTGNSFFVNKTNGEFLTNIYDLRNAIFFSGKIRAKDLSVQGSKITVAIMGDYAFHDDTLFADIKKIIAAERKFWSDTICPPFLITLLPVTSLTSGGTAYKNSFSIFYNSKFKINQGLQYLLAHEYFHTWLGQKIKQPLFEEATKWFFEGFTDYYTYRILKETSIISEEEYLSEVNQVFQKYYRNNHVDNNNTLIEENYFNMAEVKQLAYNRGHIIAILINGLIQKINNTKNLDKCIRVYCASPITFSDTSFFKHLAEEYGQVIVKVIKEILNGNNQEIQTNLYSSEYSIDFEKVSLFELGFNFVESRKQKKIMGLISGSSAELAGLQNGLPLTGSFSFSNGMPQILAKIGVMKNDVATVIEYYPAKKINRDTPVFKIKSK